jgi:hypothetical protein
VVARKSSNSILNKRSSGVWVPARVEPVIGRRFAPTRWLGRDDPG